VALKIASLTLSFRRIPKNCCSYVSVTSRTDSDTVSLPSRYGPHISGPALCLCSQLRVYSRYLEAAKDIERYLRLPSEPLDLCVYVRVTPTCPSHRPIKHNQKSLGGALSSVDLSGPSQQAVMGGLAALCLSVAMLSLGGCSPCLESVALDPSLALVKTRTKHEVSRMPPIPPIVPPKCQPINLTPRSLPLSLYSF